MDAGLHITRLRHDFIFCIDPGFWVAKSERSHRLAFNQGHGARDIARILRSDHRVRSVEWAQSLFEDAHRRDHATLTTINFEDIAPAKVRLAEPLAERVGLFDLTLSEIRFSRDGPIAFPFTARYAPANGGTHLPIEQLLRELMVVRESAHRRLAAVARSAFDITANAELFGVGDDELFSRSLQRVHRFEIIDFDYRLSDGSKPAIGDMIERVDSLAARELAGLIRMARPEVWHAYRNDFLKQFFKGNLGNRIDELWIFNSRCLVRHHPEETTRADVQLWFEDARLAMTILLQKATVLEFLHWVMKHELGEIHRSLTTAGDKLHVNAVDLLAVVEELSNRVVDPLVVERHISHEFFRKLLREAGSILEIPDLSRLCRDRIQDVRNLVQAVAAQVVSSTALNSTMATERLTKQMLWLSVLVAVLAAVQVLVAFIR
jgi:hypothetical protein